MRGILFSIYENKGVCISAHCVAVIESGLQQAVGELSCESYDSVDSFLAAPQVYDSVLLNLPASQAGQSLRLLREQPTYRYRLIYCCQDQDALCSALGDGAPPADDRMMASAVQGWKERYAALSPESLDISFETRVLAWLWSDSARRIIAVQDASKTDFYSYPLFDTLACGKAFEPLPILQQLSQQGWLSRAGLIDRVRFCARCGSRRLSQVRCLDCDKRYEQNELRMQEIYSYQLTEAGYMRCGQGLHLELAFSEHFEAQGLIGEDVFRYSLDWLLDMHRRYGEPVFSLVGLRFVTLQQAVAALGEPQGYALVDSLVERLVDIIREPDRCSRSGEDVLWLLLPNTNKEGLAKVMQRLSRLIDPFKESSPGLELRMKGIAAPLDLRIDEDAGLLLSRVGAGLK